MNEAQQGSSVFSSPLSIPLMVKKRQGKVECGDEVDHLLLDLALAKFGRTEKGMGSHQKDVNENEDQETLRILFNIFCQGLKTFTEIFLEF